MPFSSSSFTRLASLKRGGGWVKCWSVSSFLSVSASPSARGGSWPAAVVRRRVVVGRAPASSVGFVSRFSSGVSS